MLKRYLRTNFGLSPQEYRAKWNLPSDYPMVAPNYKAKRSALALSIGLGRKASTGAKTPVATAVQAAETVAEPIVKAAKAGRKKLGIAIDKSIAPEPAAAQTKPAAKPKIIRKPRAAKAG